MPKWFWSFANFDGIHYLSISRYGYAGLIGFEQVFFPLYPLLIKSLYLIIPLINSLVVGLFLSNIFFLLSFGIFAKLIRLDYKQKSIKWAILFLIAFPTSFYFGSLYTESLFFLLIISSFYAARRKLWWLAGILGGFASATRFVGIFLLPALIWEWYQCKINPSTDGQKSLSRRQAGKIKNIFCILHSPILYLVPLGLLSYMLYLQLKFGDYLYFWHAQPVFGAERSGSLIVFPFQVVWRYFKIFISLPLSEYKLWVAMFEFASFLIALTGLVLAHRQKIRPSYLIFSWLAFITPILTGTLSSMPRYILIIFPMYVAFANIKQIWTKAIILVLFTVLLTISTILFTTGYWVS